MATLARALRNTALAVACRTSAIATALDPFFPPGAPPAVDPGFDQKFWMGWGGALLEEHLQHQLIEMGW